MILLMPRESPFPLDLIESPRENVLCWFVSPGESPFSMRVIPEKAERVRQTLRSSGRPGSVLNDECFSVGLGRFSVATYTKQFPEHRGVKTGRRPIAAGGAKRS